MQGPAAPAESLSLPINHSAAVLTIIMFKCLVLQQSVDVHCVCICSACCCLGVTATCEKQGHVNKRCLWRRPDVLLFGYDHYREMRVGGPVSQCSTSELRFW